MATTYRIAEAARRTGFTPATLRYYEDLGLLRPVARTRAGYRAYDDSALDRLAFIARVKELGCSLREIVELTRSWERGRCEPVQTRLQQLLDEKIADAQARVTDLMQFTAQLQHVRAGLGAHTPAGPCDDACGCASASASFGAAVECTLDPNESGNRVADWQTVLSRACRRVAIEDGVRVELDDETELSEVARLAAAEQRCCRFFRFDITVDDRGVALEVRAPLEAADLVTTLFGSAN